MCAYRVEYSVYYVSLFLFTPQNNFCSFLLKKFVKNCFYEKDGGCSLAIDETTRTFERYPQNGMLENLLFSTNHSPVPRLQLCEMLQFSSIQDDSSGLTQP